MLSSLILFFILERRNNFSSYQIILFRFLSIIFNILFLFFASKAYNLSETFTDLNHVNVFEYIIIGDLTLRLACDALVFFNQHTRIIISNGIFDTLLNTKTPFFRIILNKGISSLLYSGLFLFVELLILFIISNYSVGFIEFLFALLLNIMALPLFISLGLINCALYIHFRRGSSVTGIITTLLSVTSGAYFPIAVFPKFFTGLISGLNPFFYLVKQTRLILSAEKILSITSYLSSLCYILAIGLIAMIISYKAMKYALKIYRKKGVRLKTLR